MPHSHTARRALASLAALALAFSLLGTAAPAAWAQTADAGSGQAEAKSIDPDSSILPTDWQAIDTCEWRIDAAGCLTIRPSDGSSGTFGLVGTHTGAPWYAMRELITSVVVEQGVSGVGSLASMLYECDAVESVDFSGLDTSAVTDMGYLFYGCSSLESLDLSGFDTSSVENMQRMFADCLSLTSLDLSGFDTSSVDNMFFMFYRCSSLTSLDLSGWDTSAATDITGMFAYCSSLTSLDVAGFDTSNVRYIARMFDGCTSLASLDVSNWDISKVTSLNALFHDCSSLTALDLSSFDTSSVTVFDSLFDGCTSLEVLDLSSFDTSSARTPGAMFDDCTSLRIVALGENVGADVSSALPVPSAAHIAGADGLWHTASGGAYLPEDVPAGVADVYYAIASEVGSYVPGFEGADPSDPDAGDTPDRFTDVDYSGDGPWGWATEWIEQAVDSGLMAGYRDDGGELTGEFGIGDQLTRGQAITVLYRAITGASADEAYGENETPSREEALSEPSYYTNAINWAFEAGIMTGDLDPETGDPLYLFRPNDSISRQELAVLVWRAAGSPAATDGGAAYSACVDAGAEADYATDALKWTAGADILSGSVEADGNHLNAWDVTLRAHAAKIFVQSLSYLQG